MKNPLILIPLVAAGIIQAQVPPAIEAGLMKIGQIVDPGCTAKLYRPLMPANDFNSSVTPLYPGITIARDISFGPNPKDVVDIFSADKGGASRPVLMYIPGGAGNKIEQQDREANAFYDNIMRWATKNGMVGVDMQRHPGPDWDSGGKDVSLMIQWVEANISKYKGNPDPGIYYMTGDGWQSCEYREGQQDAGVVITTYQSANNAVEETTGYRQLCGEGEFDIKTFVAKVRAAGWTGPWGIEVLNKKLRQEDIHTLAPKVFRTTIAQFA